MSLLLHTIIAQNAMLQGNRKNTDPKGIPPIWFWVVVFLVFVGAVLFYYFNYYNQNQ